MACRGTRFAQRVGMATKRWLAFRTGGRATDATGGVAAQSSTAAVIAFWKRSKFQSISQFSVMRVTTSK